DFLIGLDTPARMALLLVSLMGIILATIMGLIRPLRGIPDDLQIARYIEEQHPELNDGFVSAVEFEGQEMDGTARVFLDRLVGQVTDQSRQIDFSKVIDRRRLYQAEGMAVIAIVLLALFAIQDVELFGRSATRITAPWTRPGTLLSTELSVNPGDARIPRGSSQVVDVKLLGKLVPSVRLMSRLEGQDEWYPVEMFETETSGAFTYELSGIAEHTEYYVDASPATSGTFAITVYDPPRVEQIDVTYRYPAYTGLSRKTEEDKGDITAPVGTTVSLAISANKEIESGHLAFSNDKSTNLKVDGMQMTGGFKVTEDLSYTVQLVDTDDLKNENPVEYYIRAIADNMPRVTINKPGRDTQLSPIDEMGIRLEAEDDFGLSSFKLTYTVNGGEEISVDIGTESNRKSRTLWDGEHYLYLEELAVVPGDFISYYAEASDHRGAEGTTRTDMFFTTIRPFEEIYRQGQGGGGGGGGGVAGLQPGKLSQDQKEIIAATWRVDSNRRQVSEEQTTNDMNAVADAQEALRTRVAEAIDVLLFQGAMDPEMQEMSELLQQSQDPMVNASNELRAGRSAEALIPEREALHYLLKVDALIREFMVTQQNNQGQSSAPLDMTDTSELELKRDENKYETLDQSNQSQQQQQETVDESLERVKELARRQQQLNEQMRQLANQEQRSESEKQRELDRLTREQRDLREQAEEMSRQLSEMSREQQSQSQSSSQQQSQQSQQSMQQASNSLRESSDEMGQSAQQLQRNNPQEASGQGSRALQRLQDSGQQLSRAQGRSLEEMVRDAVQQADQLAAQQEQLARAVEELKKEEDRDFSGIKARVEALNNGQGSLSEADKDRQTEQFVRRRLSDISEAKEQTASDLDRLKDDLEFLSGRSASDQPQSAEALRKALRDIDEENLEQKIDRSKRLLQPNSLERSVKTEQDLAQQMEELADQIRSAQDQFTVPDRDQLAREQDQTREAMSEFQDLQRSLNRMQRRSPLPGQEEALSQRYQGQLEDLQDLSGQLPQNSQQSQNLQNQLNRAAALGNEPWKIDRADWDELRQDISRALIDVHKDLGARMDGVVEREKLFMTREEEVPPQYRDLVNRYYEKLSKESDER
ncbi:MAG: hypothetical protein HOH43_08250, partial [Candidatus Latescibacteria bacterium]|nr:hypothetical protein [Candidatus Latescibacterota bacterium]